MNFVRDHVNYPSDPDSDEAFEFDLELAEQQLQALMLKERRDELRVCSDLQNITKRSDRIEWVNKRNQEIDTQIEQLKEN